MLADEENGPRLFNTLWDRRDKDNEAVASGVCISRLVTADGQMAVCKVLVLK